MTKTFVSTMLVILILASCGTPKNNNGNMNSDNRMEFMVTKIQNEKDGQTIFLEDENEGRYTTVISPANGNFVDLKVGDKISLVAETIMESDPAQIISKDIQVILKAAPKPPGNPVKINIDTDKQSYLVEEPILLSFTITNTGEYPFLFLPWQTPLEEQLTGDCIQILYKDTTIPYIGIMVKRMPPTDEDYVILKAGESQTGQINLLDGYKLTEPGTYKIQFKESFQGLPQSNEIELTIK